MNSAEPMETTRWVRMARLFAAVGPFIADKGSAEPGQEKAPQKLKFLQQSQVHTLSSKYRPNTDVQQTQPGLRPLRSRRGSQPQKHT